MEKDELGIFGSSLCFDGYTSTAIDQEVWFRLAAARRAFAGGETHSARPLLLRLECYLQITGQKLTAATLRNPGEVRNIVLGFLGALYTPRFEAGRRPSTIYGHARLFRKLVEQALGPEFVPQISLPVSGLPGPDLVVWVNKFEQSSLPCELVEFWRGWVAHDKRGTRCHLRFHGIHLRLGAAFTERLTSACRTYMSGRAINLIPCMNELADFINEQSSDVAPESFQDPGFIEDLIFKFCRQYFVTCHKAGTRMTHARIAWSAFISFMESAVLGHIWAEPYGPLPRPEVKALVGQATNVELRNGSSFKTKLLTPIPLHLRDEDAKAALFDQIEQEVEWVKTWAQGEVDAIWTRYQRQLREAPKGEVSKVGAKGTVSGLGWRVSRENPSWLAHAAATFQAYGPAPELPTAEMYAIYPRPYPETAWELGIPNQPVLMAFASLLVSCHPEITPGFLETLEAYDASGNERGVRREDGRMYLLGFKRRKGPNQAQQEIELGPQTSIAVDRLLKLTAPLRDRMRSCGDPKWRRLFIFGGLTTMPRPWRSALIECHRPWLASRFQEHLALPADTATDLSYRFALSRLRSSVAALIYLKTGSVQKMAAALGHTRWKPSLLDHYLPKILHEFFVERWIRIFQTGIIVEALKDSPFLQRATAFATLDELHQFLQNHALEYSPPEEDQRNASSTPPSKVLIGIDVGILTMLLSVERAVTSSVKPVATNARYWAHVAGLLARHIENDPLRTDFRAMLELARQSICVKSVERLIYV